MVQLSWKRSIDCKGKKAISISFLVYILLILAALLAVVLLILLIRLQKLSKDINNLPSFEKARGNGSPSAAKPQEELKKPQAYQTARHTDDKTVYSSDDETEEDKTVCSQEKVQNDDKTVFPSEGVQDSDKTVYSSEDAQDSDKTVYSSEDVQDNDKTVYSSEDERDDDRTVYSSDTGDEQDQTVLLSQDEVAPVSRPAGRSHGAFRIVLLNKNSGESWNLTLYRDSSIIIGRDPACRVCLNEKSVSQYQCVLFLNDAGKPMVENKSRSNVTKLNGRDMSSPQILTEGDEIKCGRILLAAVSVSSL